MCRVVAIRSVLLGRHPSGMLYSPLMKVKRITALVEHTHIYLPSDGSFFKSPRDLQIDRLIAGWLYKGYSKEFHFPPLFGTDEAFVVAVLLQHTECDGRSG